MSATLRTKRLAEIAEQLLAQRGLDSAAFARDLRDALADAREGSDMPVRIPPDLPEASPLIKPTKIGVEAAYEIVELLA